ncbi:Uncharacterized membrane protein, DUF4010 family [Sulfurivirga caldicuralii]|uniref:Uncharacterized membrane protein, DUF4010 family n=1 Tax=Sulfurivirga caldicuralii TaxID=364032 RepID=A0A1N6HDA6_9GAMM|nr:DUF4010 domain-containing protein [Sulfurivirga caldicuralii]SIO17770.1 Uncharacterized membrane protein, DUF4010 family [Sulfurivirga caldicuralii]
MLLSHLQHELWFQLLLVLVFGFLTGLEIREYRRNFGKEEPQLYLGSTRTYTFIALTGWVLYKLTPISFYTGLGALTLLYALLYWRQLRLSFTSMFTFIIAVLVYHYGMLVDKYPLWLLVAVFVAIVFLLHMREQFVRVSRALAPVEVFTLAKLLLLSAVILPLLPDHQVAAWLPVTPFKTWLAVVVVSAISYLGYVAQRYLFPDKGVLITALFGGIYSSTATTVVLARQSNQLPRPYRKWAAGIVLATGMMYLRLIAIAALFDLAIARLIAVPLAAMALLALIVTAGLLWIERRDGFKPVAIEHSHTNPLELKVAFVFAGLFVLMAVITQLVTQHFGEMGLSILSLVVGFTDIDPFVLSILNGQFHASTAQLASAIVLAAGSNNLLKAAYAVWFGHRDSGLLSALWLGILGLLTIVLGFMLF